MIFYSWAWTPHRVARMDKKEREKEGLLILPDTPFETTDSAIAHFSQIREGKQYSWLWLFEDTDTRSGRVEACALRMLPTCIPDNDPAGTLIDATIPRVPSGNPPETYLQVVPVEWLLDWDLSEIQEVWLGFNYKVFVRDRSLQASSQVFSTEEFVEYCRRKK